MKRNTAEQQRIFRIFKKTYRRHFYVKFFQISGIFPSCFGCFIPANTTNKNRSIIEILLYHFFAIFKVSRPVAVETETRPETFETETRKNWSRYSSRDGDQSRDSITVMVVSSFFQV